MDNSTIHLQEIETKISESITTLGKIFIPKVESLHGYCAFEGSWGVFDSDDDVKVCEKLFLLYNHLKKFCFSY